MFKCNLKSHIFVLFLLLLLVSTLEGRCLLNCSRKAQNSESDEDKIRDSILITVKKSENALHYQPNNMSETSNTKSKNNLAKISVKQEDNVIFSSKQHPSTRRPAVNLKETSHKSKRNFLKRHPNLLNRKIFIKRNVKYSTNRKRPGQRAIDEKQHAAEFHEQLHNPSTEKNVLERHFRKYNKKTTKRPIVFRLKHSKETLSKSKTHNQELKKQFSFDSNGFKMPENENFIKNFTLRNKTIRYLKHIGDKFQFFSASKKLPRHVLDNISRVDLIFGKIPTSFYHINKNSIQQLDGLDIKDTNSATSLKTSNVISTVSKALPVVNDKLVKMMNNATFVTNTPMYTFHEPISENNTDFLQSLYRFDVKQLDKNKEDLSDSIRNPDKKEVNQFRNSRDEFKQGISVKRQYKRDFYTAHPAIFTLPAAKIWYESDQKNYLVSKVNIHLPKMDSNEKSSHKELNIMPIQPFLKNLKNSDVMKSTHVHRKLYHPNLQKHPSLLNATTQHGIRQLLLFLRKMINSSKTETEASRITTQKSPSETFATTTSSTVSAKSKEGLSSVSYTPKVNAEDKAWLDVISFPPDVHANNKEWLGTIPEILEATENVKNASNYITIEYQRNVEIIATPVNSQYTNFVWPIVGVFGLVLIIAVCVVIVIIVLTEIRRKRENKVPFSLSDYFKKWPNSGREIVPSEDNIDPCDPLYMSDSFIEENRELKRAVSRVLRDMEFYSDSELEELYLPKEHNKKLENAMSGIIK